eukprot:PhF_6_TR33809/c0_g1_i1/m.49579
MSSETTPKKVVIVTGGARGIGRAICTNMSRNGYIVAVNYHTNHAAAQETLSMLSPGDHKIFPADVSTPEGCKKLVDDVLAAYGRVDALVNNAGVCPEHDILTVNYEEFQKAFQNTIETNLTGPSNLSYCVVQHFMSRAKHSNGERGRIVNVTSRAAYRGELTCAGYAASKAGLNIFGQSLARRLAPEGIYVYSVAPGWVETELAHAVLHGPDGLEVLKQHP